MRKLIYILKALNTRYLKPIIIGYIICIYCTLLYLFLVYQGVVVPTDKHIYLWVDRMMGAGKFRLFVIILIGALVLSYAGFGKSILARHHPRFLRVVRYFCYIALDISVIAFFVCNTLFLLYVLQSLPCHSTCANQSVSPAALHFYCQSVGFDDGFHTPYERVEGIARVRLLWPNGSANLGFG